jgi:uroporphyrin-III C-methyltransferase
MKSRASTLHLADMLRARRVAAQVLTAFLDDDPPVGTLIEAAACRHLLVIPFLIGGGTHEIADIPRLLGLSRLPTPDSRLVHVDQAVGSYPRIVDIIVDLARRNAPARRRQPGVAPMPSPSSRSLVSGTVDLVGGGPGDPGLITVRGLQLLQSADVVIHDRLIGSELLGVTRREALLIDVGKGPGHAPYSQEEINALLLEHARQGKSVVRLKGGDPFVFGRGSEEMNACRRAGVRVRVVPGVTSAIAGPAAAGIPVTARGISRSFTVVTAHTTEDALASSGCPSSASFVSAAVADTLVIMMGRSNLATLAAELIRRGRDPSTPAACIQSATTSNQCVTRATLATIAEAADRDGLVSPVITVIGEVAAMGAESDWPNRRIVETTPHPERSEGPALLVS